MPPRKKPAPRRISPPPAVQRRLLAAAGKAAARSYSPYSRFPVGAALLTAGGTIVSGCNVENSSYGLTLCAERTAVFAAVAAGHRQFRALAVIGGRDRPARPCGACLQVLAEFCQPGLPVLLASHKAPFQPEVLTLGELLPEAFHLKP